MGEEDQNTPHALQLTGHLIKRGKKKIIAHLGCKEKGEREGGTTDLS